MISRRGRPSGKSSEIKPGSHFKRFVYKVKTRAAFPLVADQNMRTNVHKQMFLTENSVKRQG